MQETFFLFFLVVMYFVVKYAVFFLVVLRILDPGSGSVGSVCFWASRICIRIRESEIRIRILLYSAKVVRKNLDSYCFVTSLCLFIFEK